MAQRVAVVTGGMGGLGEAICMKLSGMGYKVVATYSPGNKKSAEWLAEMKKQGHDFYAIEVDVAGLRLLPARRGARSLRNRARWTCS